MIKNFTIIMFVFTISFASSNKGIERVISKTWGELPPLEIFKISSSKFSLNHDI